jgi:predicted regulator of Ras-like GTPase activity (Roadblock/LC7/MglB family)
MSLRLALRPLLGTDGLVALLVSTSDGLPVEMFGYGLRAEQLAAEVAGLARAARLAFGALGLGEPNRQQFSLEGHTVDIFPVDGYYLAVVTDGDRASDVAPLVRERTLVPLGMALRGES